MSCTTQSRLSVNYGDGYSPKSYLNYYNLESRERKGRDQESNRSCLKQKKYDTIWFGFTVRGFRGQELIAWSTRMKRPSFVVFFPLFFFFPPTEDKRYARNKLMYCVGRNRIHRRTWC